MGRIDELFEQFLRVQEVTGLSETTLRGYRQSFKRFREILPDVDLEDINEDRVIDFMEKLKYRKRTVGKGKLVCGIERSTIRNYKCKLSAFFNWLIRRKLIQHNPFQYTRSPRIIQKGRKYLTQNEIKKILWAIGFDIKWKSPMVKTRNIAIINIALYCGLRKNELLSLKLSDIDFRNRLIQIRGVTSKSKIDRNISINHQLYKALTEYLTERNERGYMSPYLFVSDNKDARLSPHGLEHTIKRISKHIKFKFHMHQFRHTFAANIHYTGQDIYVIQRLLGHHDIKMTTEYVRRFPSERAKQCVDNLLLDEML